MMDMLHIGLGKARNLLTTNGIGYGIDKRNTDVIGLRFGGGEQKKGL